MKNIRYYVFWIIDFLKGSKIAAHYNELKKTFEDVEFCKLRQQVNLSKILDYARSNTLFYNNVKSLKLEDFPIINKHIVTKNYDDFFSREFISQKESLRVMSTSGSSGTPFKIHQNKDKFLRNKADLLFFYYLGNYNIGDKMYFLRIWNSVNKKNKLSLLKENFGMLDTSDLSRNGAENIQKILLNDKKSKVILGYASSFTALIDHFKGLTNEKWNIKSIITGAEELPKDTKKKMQTIFNCPVMSRYSNQENGILAQQPITGEDYFLLNEGSYYFEFLKIDSNEYAEIGEDARIVVTDLYNKAVPMIRYDTGDVCKIDVIDKRKVIVSIVGRKIDYLRTCQNKLISPHIITNLMWKYSIVKEFQLIQKTLLDIHMYISLKTSDFNSDPLVNDLKKVFGDSVNIKIIVLDSIPLEKSGKRKYIKSLIS